MKLCINLVQIVNRGDGDQLRQLMKMTEQKTNKNNDLNHMHSFDQSALNQISVLQKETLGKNLQII